MPIRPPALDDRSFDDLVAEMLRRIPAHTPEWTNPVEGDPGRTLIDLFAWLADTILYRANLIPERQRLAFLRLLGIPMRPAQSARGLVALSLAQPDPPRAITFPKHSRIAKPAPFETEQEVTVMPVSAQCFIKQRLGLAGETYPAGFLDELAGAYAMPGAPITGYVTTPVFMEGKAEPEGRDIAAQSIDGHLWMALLAHKPDAAHRAAVRVALTEGPDNTRPAINIGLAPALAMPSLFEDIGSRLRMDQAWHVEGPLLDGQPMFMPLDLLSDGTEGLTKAGVVRLLLPGADDVSNAPTDVLMDVNAGVGQRPPRLDDPALHARVITWLRFKPAPGQRLESFKLAWAGINAVSIEQRETLGRRSLGPGTGASGQEFSLGADSVEAESLEIEVDDEAGLRRWRQVPDVAAARFDEPVYSLDSEAGVIRFGDGVRGRVPGAGRMVEAARLRSGGGAQGQLAAGSIKEMDKSTTNGPLVKVMQPLATAGGADAEDLATCERRIPQMLRHQNRAVTAGDYRELALRTPGVAVGRVEVLAQFKPQQRRFNVPGVVSVMVLPAREGRQTPAPRADRPFLEAVHGWLDERRPLTTQLYVIGCEYVPMAVSVGVDLVDPDQRDAVLGEVREAIRTWLWALSPGGPQGEGWPLGRMVQDREIEVAVARVRGIASVLDVRLFSQPQGQTNWSEVTRVRGRGVVELKAWQLPELVGVVVAQGAAPERIDGLMLPPKPDGPPTVAIPVVPELC